MMLDLVLAIVHHLLILSLAAVLGMEIVLVRVGMGGAELRRLAAIDFGYGMAAAGLLVIGVARAVFGAKGWSYYATNYLFWAKITAFVLIGLLSVTPTIRFARWAAAVRKGRSEGPTAAEIARVRRFLWAEVALFVSLPAFAAAMARGYGE